MSIQPGIYRIKNVKSGTYFDASLQDKGTVHGWGFRPENENQKWIAEPSGQGFTLKNADTGDYVSAGGPEDGTRVECTPNQNEWWIKEAEGNYAIHVAGMDFVCDLDMGREEDGTTINLWRWTGAPQQTWCFERVGDIPVAAAPQYQPQEQVTYQPQAPIQGTYTSAVAPGVYRIKNAFSGTVIDLAGGETADGTPITGWEAGNGSNQTWSLLPGQSGYVFKNNQSGTYLGYVGDGVEGVMICGVHNAVEWQVNQGSQGFQIRAASNPSIVCDLAGGGKDNGVKICLYSDHSGPNQQWVFEPVA